MRTGPLLGFVLVGLMASCLAGCPIQVTASIRNTSGGLVQLVMPDRTIPIPPMGRIVLEEAKMRNMVTDEQGRPRMQLRFPGGLDRCYLMAFSHIPDSDKSGSDPRIVHLAIRTDGQIVSVSPLDSGKTFDTGSHGGLTEVDCP